MTTPSNIFFPADPPERGCAAPPLPGAVDNVEVGAFAVLKLGGNGIEPAGTCWGAAGTSVGPSID